MFSARGNGANAKISEDTYQKKKEGKKKIYECTTFVNNITMALLHV
jgi:hypothetical protein